MIFCFQIGVVVWGNSHQAGYPLHYFNACILQTMDLFRVVGVESDSGDAQVEKNLGGQVVLAHVCREAEELIGINSVCTVVLQAVGTQLVTQANAAAFLA